MVHWLQEAIVVPEALPASKSKKRKRLASATGSLSTSSSGGSKLNVAVITEIFDGTDMVTLVKPTDQTKVFTRDLDPTGKEIMAKISTYCPLYLATRDAFPDVDTSHRTNYCSQMFKTVVNLLRAKYSKEKEHLVRLQQAKENYRQNEVYQHIFQILVRLPVKVPSTLLIFHPGSISDLAKNQ